MKLLQRIALAASFAWGLTASAATPVSQVVSDRAPFIISFSNVPSLISEWGTSPWAKTWDDEQMKKFLAPLRAQMKVDEWSAKAKEKTGYTLQELLAFATGDAVFAVTSVDFSSENKTPPLLFAVEVGDNQSKLEALLVKDAKEHNRTDEVTEFSGVSVHTVQPKEGEKEPMVWAVHDGKWLISQSKDIVIAAIDGINNGGVENSWGRSERFARLKERGSNPHVSFLINVEALYPAMKQAMEERAANAQQQQGPMAFDPSALLTALGLDALRDLYGTFRIGDDATQINFGVNYTELRGLMKLLAYKDGPLEKPRFIQANSLTVSSDRFSLKEMYAALEEILEAFNPAISGFVQGQIRNLNKQLGIDLKRDLIGSLGDTVVTAAFAPPANAGEPTPGVPVMPQLIGISLGDAKSFTSAIDALKRLAGPQAESLFQTREYLGQTIHTFQSPAPAGAPNQGFSYAIANGYLLLSMGSAMPVESALQGMSGDRASIWEKTEVREAFARVPANASSFAYQDMKALLPVFIDAFRSAVLMGGAKAPATLPDEGEAGAEGEDAAPKTEENRLPIDPTFRPDTDALARHWAYGWGFVTRDSSGMHLTSQILHAK
jgi:hypothetical protein